MATYLVSCSTSSISRTILNYFLKSKLLKFCNVCIREINSHRVKNFEKLEPTFRNLNVKFDSTIVDKIMKGERGCALRLLY